MNAQPLDKRNLTAATLAYALGGIIAIAALFFLCAGTFDYWQAWVFIVLTVIILAPMIIWLLRNSPDLMARRMQARERETSQKLVAFLVAILFSLVLILPGFDRRFSWSQVPLWLELLGFALLIAAYVLYMRVVQVNRFASRAIEVVKGQEVVRTGPYTIVRHPMYLADILFGLGLALALGSYWTLFPALAILPTLAWRAYNEEKTLLGGLPGYADYTHKVRWRLIPGIW
jgi:protein-S-isoprenylcysteine O-methyltransferase Ste14